MKHDEAVAIRQAHLNGRQQDPRLLERAMQTINLGNTISMGHRDIWKVEPLSETMRERTNCVLIFRLALACGLLNKWKARP
jgi:hypothetical protein